MSNDVVIKVENLSKLFHLRHSAHSENGNADRELWALKNISFEIKRGESVGIIGPNGCGKSTLLKILSKITSPTEGRAIIRGRVASILDIGAGFHPELTGRENVFLNGQLHGFSRTHIRSRMQAIEDFSGIGKFMDQPVKNYSNGMYLRLAFSIMAHLDFDVYLLDEVFAAGDLTFQLKCKEHLKSLTSGTKTVVCVSHSLSEISGLCEKIMTFDADGRLNEGGLELIEAYITKMTKRNLVPTLPDFYVVDEKQLAAGQTDSCTIEQVSISATDVLENGISSSADVTVTIHVRLNSNTEIDIGMILYDRLKTRLFSFSSIDNGSLKDKGFYEVSFRIPGKILSGQVYTMDMIVAENKAQIIADIKDVVVFKVETSNPKKMIFKDQLNDSISPEIQVSISKNK